VTHQDLAVILQPGVASLYDPAACAANRIGLDRATGAADQVGLGGLRRAFMVMATSLALAAMPPWKLRVANCR